MIEPQATCWTSSHSQLLFSHIVYLYFPQTYQGSFHVMPFFSLAVFSALDKKVINSIVFCWVLTVGRNPQVQIHREQLHMCRAQSSSQRDLGISSIKPTNSPCSKSGWDHPGHKIKYQKTTWNKHTYNRKWIFKTQRCSFWKLGPKLPLLRLCLLLVTYLI